MPFSPVRTFAVVGRANQLRGKHAHKHCRQILVALVGQIEVRTEWAGTEAMFSLASPAIGLYLPPMTWAEQRYVEEQAVLLAVCDLPFDEGDYIRHYDSYVRLNAKHP